MGGSVGGRETERNGGTKGPTDGWRDGPTEGRREQAGDCEKGPGGGGEGEEVHATSTPQRSRPRPRYGPTPTPPVHTSIPRSLSLTPFLRRSIGPSVPVSVPVSLPLSLSPSLSLLFPSPFLRCLPFRPSVPRPLSSLSHRSGAARSIRHGMTTRMRSSA